MEYKHVYTGTLTVRWSDLDLLGHVNNAKYFTYVEQARIEWFETLGSLDDPIGPVLAAVDMTFKKPIFHPATLEVKLYAGEAGRSSFRVKHEIYNNGVLQAEGNSTLVWVSYPDVKPVPLPQKMKDLIPSRKI